MILPKPDDPLDLPDKWFNWRVEETIEVNKYQVVDVKTMPAPWEDDQIMFTIKLPYRATDEDLAVALVASIEVAPPQRDLKPRRFY